MSGIPHSIAGPRSSTETTERPRVTITTATILVGRSVLLVAVTLAAWCFGGVQAHVQLWLFTALAVVCASWLLCQWSHHELLGSLPWALVPLLLALGWVALELIPLNQQVLERLSPKAVALRQALGSESNPSDVALVNQLDLPKLEPLEPVSLSPASTRKELTLLLVVTAALGMGAMLFSRGQSFLWLLAILAANGGALAFFGIVQWLTSNKKIFWTVPLSYGGSPFGPFVNRNNAGGLLLVCLAGALATTVWLFRREHWAGDTTGCGATLVWHRSWWERQRDAAGRYLSRLDGWKLTALSLLVCIVAGIFCSLSRGAVIAMIGASLVTAFVVWLAWRRDWLPVRLGVVAGVAGVALVSWAGMSAPVRHRMATLLDLGTASKPLLTHWSDSVHAVPDFWQMGSGLGTYRFVYEQYQRSPHPSWFLYAENLYLESLLETGVVGLILMIVLAALLAAASWRLLRQGPDTATLALGVAGVFAISAQAIDALFDFGLRVPANVLTMAVLCGAIAGRAAVVRRGRLAAGGQGPRSGRRWLPVLASMAFLIGLVWSCWETRQVAAVEVAMKRMDQLGPEGSQALAEVQRVREDLEHSVQARPDAQALCCLAYLDLQCYRLKIYERFCRQVPAETDRNALWKATRPTVLHGRIQQYAAAGDVRSLERIRSEPAVVDHLLPALRRLVLARRACPLLPQMHLLIAELGVLASEPAENQIHLIRAQGVGPAQAALALECGIVEFQAGRPAEAITSWRRCLALDAAQLPEIARRLRAMGKASEMLPQVLPDSPETLVQVAQDERMSGSDASLRAKLLDQAAAAIDRSGGSEAERCYWRGAIGALRGDPAAAIDEYLRAVELDPQNLDWRYELAVLLEGQGRWTEAHEQARYCALMEPTKAKYRRLLKEVGRARIAAGEDVSQK